jgi:hypothetical protein
MTEGMMQLRLSKASVIKAIPILVAVSAMVFLLWPAWGNNLRFYDDSHLIFESQHSGFWGPTEAFVDLWGLYRIGYVALLSPVYAIAEHLWLIKLVGVLLHVGNALLARSLWLRFGGGKLGGAMVLASVALYPFALEAVAWPATVPEYALGPFILLLGALIACRDGARSTFYGGAVMGASLLLHEQLLAPLIVLLFVLLRRERERRKGLVIGASLTGGLAMLLLLSSFGTNPRLSGADGASIDNVLSNLPYINDQLRRSTPFGDFFWSTGGFELPYVWIFAILGTLIVLPWLFIRRTEDQRGFDFPLSAMSLAAIAWLGSVLPIISSGFPWHTPRVMYIPSIALAFFLGGAVEALSRMAGQASVATVVVGLFVVAWAVWGAMALGAEARSLRAQLTLNDERLDSLVAAIEPSRDLTDTSLLVVAGWPGWDTQRPFFGEHMIGMTAGELRTRLGLSVYRQSPTPVFNFRPGWDGVCLEVDGQLGLLPAWIELHQLDMPPEGATYAVWLDEQWQVQRGSEALPATDELIGIVPACAS